MRGRQKGSLKGLPPDFVCRGWGRFCRGSSPVEDGLCGECAAKRDMVLGGSEVIVMTDDGSQVVGKTERRRRAKNNFRLVRCKVPRCNRFTVNRGGVCKVCLNFQRDQPGIFRCR